jgi:photosystem II stability/assembly factor-like uncharacterized protein
MKKGVVVFRLVLLGFSLTISGIHAQWVQTSAPEGVYVYAFAASDTYVFTDVNMDGPVATGGSVLRSSDNGANWSEANNGLTAPEVRALAIKDTYIFAGSGGGGVFRSSDNGNSWNAVNTGLTNLTVMTLVVSGADIFVGTGGGGVFRSTDNGENWTEVNSGLTNLSIWTLSVSDAGMFASTHDGLFHSTNDGAIWTDISNGMPRFEWLGPLAVCDTNIYAGFGGGLYFSADYGANWTDICSGLPDPGVFDLAVIDTCLFALTNWGGVSFTTDHGANWTLVNEGLIDTLVSAIGISKTFVFIGGSSGIVWRRPLAEMVTLGMVNTGNYLPLNFALHQNYPNPFNPMSTIRYDLPQASEVSLIVYDMLGRELAGLASGFRQPGYHQIQWDSRDARDRELPSGIYIARLTTPEYSKSIKMVLLK